MSLLSDELANGRRRARVGDLYEVTRKPRGLDPGAFDAVPFVPMEAVPQGGEFSPKYIEKSPRETTSGTYFEKGDVLLAKITPSFENGKQALALDLPARFGYATTEVIPLRPRDARQDRRFLFFYLLHPDVRAHLAGRMEGSTGRHRVPEGVLLDLPIPELPADDQRSIADALEAIRNAAGAERRSEEAAVRLKRAAMRELFTRGLRGEAQKETEIGPIPESWRVVEFGSTREWLQYGSSRRCTYDPSEYPVLRIPNIESGRIRVRDLKFCSMPASEADSYRLETGDLIFVRTNGVLERLGSCAVYDGRPKNALFASYLIRARLRPNCLDPRFAAFYLGSEHGTSIVANRATPAADGKYNLNSGTIDSLPIPLPPTLREQQEIVSVLDAVDRKTGLHRTKRAALDKLFKALLHKLITGEIPVADLDLAALASAPAAEEAA